jgi:hypothetical protein
MSYPITVSDKTFTSTNTYNPDTPDFKTDGESVLCFSGPNLDSDGNPLPVRVNNCIIDGERFRWGSKQSMIFDLEFNNCTFMNGTKRAFDMVRGGKVVFNQCEWRNNEGVRPVVKSPIFTLAEQTDCGIKGGVHDVTFNNCKINDVFLGDYTIYDQQDRPKVRRVTFNDCTNPNGGAIIVRARWFEGNTIQKINTPINAWTWPSFVTSIYWWYNRKFGDTRKPDGWNVILPQERD